MSVKKLSSNPAASPLAIEELIFGPVIDLHTHSNRSDGSESPGHLVELAASVGLTALALTDHDTTDGLAEAATRAAELDIYFVPGIELSCHTPERTVHMLAYMFDAENPQLITALAKQQALRNERNLHLIEVLQALDYEISMDEVLAIANGATVGRPHFARALVERGYFESIDRAFAELLGDGQRAYVERREFDAKDAIDVIHGAGGLAVWAHPMRNRDVTDMDATLRWLANKGLDGVEAYYSRFTSEQRAYVVRAARNAHLVATGGSDFHGSYKPDLFLGTGTGNLSIPDQIIDQLLVRRTQLFEN